MAALDALLPTIRSASQLFPKERKMSSKIDVINQWHEETWSNPPASAVAAAEKFLAENFKNLDKDGKVVGDKAGMVGMSALLYKAFPDFKGVVHDVVEQDGGVMLTFHFEGTHKNDLDLSAMGMGVIPASGKHMVTPESKTLFMVENGQITSGRAVSGGIEDILVGIGAIPATGD